ncbi:MAG: NAD-dependent epimerase/dehydratase family protein [Promethearchaeota archaeon]
MSKNVLVTGAKGHTGSFLVKYLVDECACNVVAMDLPPRERAEVMKKEKVFRSDLHYIDIESLPNVEFIPADLTDKESLRKLFQGRQYDVIFHPASLYDYFAKIDILRKINVGGLRNFLEVIHEELGDFPRFIHWSTCGVYGEPKYERDPKTKQLIPADETTPYDPPNPYSISKMEQEILLKDLAGKFNIPYTIVRPAPIYGPYQMYGMFHIFYMLHKMGCGTSIHVYPRRHRLMMPMIHVETLVEAAWFLSQKEEAIGEAYNVVEDLVTQEDWLEFVSQHLGLRYLILPIWWPLYKFFAKLIYGRFKHDYEKAHEWGGGIRPKIDLSMADYITHQYAFSNKKLKDLGFKFKYNPYEGTEETLRWYLEHGWFESEEFRTINTAKTVEVA